jgi:uncharacterized protein
MTNFNTISSRRSFAPAPLAKPSAGAAALLGAISFYQRLTKGRISPCRFYPSCSQYAAEAIEVHGAWRGTGLSVRRVLKCRPFGPHGVDLVPLSSKVRSTKS